MDSTLHLIQAESEQNSCDTDFTSVHTGPVWLQVVMGDLEQEQVPGGTLLLMWAR